MPPQKKQAFHFEIAIILSTNKVLGSNRPKFVDVQIVLVGLIIHPPKQLIRGDIFEYGTQSDDLLAS